MTTTARSCCLPAGDGSPIEVDGVEDEAVVEHRRAVANQRNPWPAQAGVATLDTISSGRECDTVSGSRSTMMDDVRVLNDAELREATGTPGMHRRVAFDADDGYWFGHVETDPETLSGWHHHGDNVTIGYVVEGHVRFEFGPDGGQTVEASAGEYFQVPAGLVHREGNPTSTPGQIVLIRVGEGPPVFPVDGPEPA